MTLERDGLPVRVAPLAIYATLKEVHALRRFQLVVHPGNQLELRLLSVDGVTREAAFAQAEEKLKAFLAARSIVDYSCTLSEEGPKASPTSGKFKHIISM